MGGSGVINIERVDQMRPGFVYFSHWLDYPSDELLQPTLVADFARDYPETPNKAALVAWIKQLQQKSLFDLQQEYSNLFDLNKRFTLYLSYYRYQDSRERGQLLAKLKMLYEMFGVSVEGDELADYFPLMLEFLTYGNWDQDERQQDIGLVFQVIEDGTYNLLKNEAEYAGEAYLELIRLLRQEFKSCIGAQQEVS
jgi:nitrate reductase delta subunit